MIRIYSGVEAVSTRQAANIAAASERIAIVHRGRPRWVVLLCPCGCGDVLSINLDPRSGRAWRLKTQSETVSLIPSVWRSTGCCSHFILWSNEVWLFGQDWDDYGRRDLPIDADSTLTIEWAKSRSER